MKRRQFFLLFTLIAFFICNNVKTYGNAGISVASFKFQRTVLKPGDEIPVVARIWNNNINDLEVNLELELTDNLALANGSLTQSISLGHLSYTEVKWNVIAYDIGEIGATLNIIFGSGETIKAQVSGSVTDKFWKQKEFLLSAWSPPSYNQLSYGYFKAANFDFNLRVNPPFSEGVNMVKNNNMKCFVTITKVIPKYLEKLFASDGTPPEITNADLELLDSTINEYKSESSVEGYSIIDEPDASKFKNLSLVVEYIREKDPEKLAFINMFPTYASAVQLNASSYSEYISKFLDEVKPEMLSYDHYHFFTDHDGEGYFDNLGIIRNFGLKYNIPYTNTIQLVGTEYFTGGSVLDWRTPTPEEHRFLVYSSLAYGYTGIIWFHWQKYWGLTGYISSKEAELYASVSQLNKEISNIGDEIIKLKSVGVYHVNDVPFGGESLPENEIITGISGDQSYVAGIFKDSQQADYFMVMNKDYTTASQTTISLKNKLSKLEFFNVESDSWDEVSDFTSNGNGSKFSVFLAAGNGILFRPSWNMHGVSQY